MLGELLDDVQQHATLVQCPVRSMEIGIRAVTRRRARLDLGQIGSQAELGSVDLRDQFRDRAARAELAGPVPMHRTTGDDMPGPVLH
ncbi:MAG TPA: hypothetical protein VGH89_05070, partial [Pseudonocardia sp.]